MKRFLRFLALVALMCVPWVTQGQQAIPYSYGFEDNDLSTDGWILSGSTSSNTKIYTETAPEGTHLFKFHYSEQNAHLISPVLTGTENGVTVTFQYTRSSSSSSYVEKFKVGYTTDANETDPTAFTYGDEIVTTTSWEEYENTFPAGTKRIAIKYIYIDGMYLRLDDFNFTAPPSCLKVTGVNVSNISTSSARINWTIPTGQTASYKIYNGDDWVLTTEEGATYATVPGLTASTTYANFKVRANCGATDGTSDFVSVPSFKTLCNGVATYSTNFDDMTAGNVPDCWTVVAGSCDIYSYSSPKSGSNHLRLCNATNIVVLPAPLSVETNTMQLEFYAKMIYTSYSSSYYYNGDLQVGYLTNPSDASSFVAVRTLAYGSDYTSYPATAIKVPMTSAPAGAVMAFRCQPYYASTSYGWYIDDVTIGEAPNCLPVENLQYSNLTLNSVTLTWNAGPTGATYTVKNGDVVLVEATPANATSCNIPGLTAETNYTLSVYTNCSGSETSEDAATISFYTGYCQPAPSNVDGSGITAVSFGTGEGTTVANSGSKLPPSSPYYGNYSSMIGAVAAGTAANIEITYKTSCTYSTVIWVDWNNNLTFEDNEVVYTGSIGSGSTEIQQASFDISAAQALGDYRLRIGAADSYFDSYVGGNTSANHDPCYTGTWAVFHDYTLRVTEAPSCMPVSNLTAPVENIASNSVALTWTDNNNGSATYIIADGEDNEIPAAQISSLTATGVTITGLTPNTAYTFKVKADCGGGEFSDAASVNVRTACGQEVIPFTENFDSYSASSYSNGVQNPSCWTMVPEPTSYGSYTTVIYNASAHSGSNHLRSYYATNNKIILPEMDAATNTLQVRFWHRQYYSGTYGSLQVGYLTDVADTSTFVAVQSFSNIGTTYIESEVSFESAPASARIAFRHLGSGTYNYTWYIDDITVELIPACKNVTAVVAPTNVTSSGATLSWTDTRNDGAVYKVYNNATEPATLLGTTEAGVKTINLTGLTASTTYNQLVIVASCSETEQSGEVSVPSFTTQSNACDITGITISTPAGITRGDAVINAVNHTVTLPVYYMTAEELGTLAGTISKSTNAHVYIYNETAGDWTTEVYSMAGLQGKIAMNTPLTVRVKAQDATVYQDWTITLQGEDCSMPRSIDFVRERTSITATWVNADPSAINYQVVISASALDAAGLEAAEKTAVNGAKTYTFTGLLRETEYHVYVRTDCGSSTYSNWLGGTVTTKGLTFCDDVPVAAGDNTNNVLPLDGYNTDGNAQHSQSIYPASMLSSLVGKSLTSMYYSGSTSSGSGDWGTVTVKLGITEEESLTELLSTEHFVTVSTATMLPSDGKIMITFDEPFAYNGGNLVVDVELPTAAGSGHWQRFNVQGQTRTNGSYNNYASSSSANFLPQLTFHYCETLEACPAVTEIEASDITETGATITWDAATGDYLSGYQVIQSATELDAAALDAYTGSYVYEGDALTCNLTGLTAYTEYYIYVRANCGAPDNANSQWLGYSFRTLSACGVVSNLEVAITGKHTATATWEKTKPTQDNNFNYILSTTADLDDAVLNGMTPTESGITELTADLTGLTSATTYYLYVQNDCSGEGTSPWVSASFTTPEAMPAVLNITATEVTHTAIAATWEKNEAQYADESAWQVAAVAHGETPAAWQVANATHYTFIGLTPETSYDIYVRPYQASPEAFGTQAHLDEVVTAAMPGDCAVIGDGTSTTNGYFFPGYYGFQYSAYLYDVEQSGNLNAISAYLATGNNSTGSTMKVWVKVVDANYTLDASSTFASMTEGATLIYDAEGAFTTAQVGWIEFPIASPITVAAGQQLLVMVRGTGCTTSGGCSRYERYTSATNKMWYKRADSSDPGDNATGALGSYRANMKFCYEPASCRDMFIVAVSDITTNSANVHWMPGNTETIWQYLYSIGETAEADRAAAATTTSNTEIVLGGLTRDEGYHFYIRPVCGVDEYGSWTMRQFQTLATCGLPTVLAATDVTATTATLHALAHPTIGTAQNYTFRYWIAGNEANKTVVDPSTENSAVLTGLTPNTTYYYDVMVSCGENDDSRWSEPKSFLTDYQNLTLPYSTTFAEGHDNEWRMVNNSAHVNKWVIGNAAGIGEPVRGMYISQDGGVTNTYYGSDYNVVYAYAAFSNFEAAKQYTINFDWTCYGESSADYMRAWLVPDNVTLTAGTALPANAGPSTNPTGWIPVDGTTKMNLQYDKWYHKTSYVTVPTDGAYKLVFLWRQDNSVAHDPAGSIDNVSIAESEKYTVTVNVTKDAENTPLGSYTSVPTTLTDVYDNTEVVLTAGNPIYGYQWVNWTDNNGAVKGSGRYVYLTLHSDTVLNANYDSLEFTITPAMVTKQKTEAWGAVSDPTTVKFNLPVTIMAEANEGYHFVNWTSLVSGEPVVAGTETSLTVNAYRDSTFTAHFDTNVYNVTVNVTRNNARNENMGNVEGPATIKHFLDADYVATAATGYHFVNWTNAGGTELASDATLNIAPVSDTTVNANFAFNNYAIGATAEHGTVTGAGNYDHFATATLVATPATGYHFVNWTEGDEAVSTEAT